MRGFLGGIGCSRRKAAIRSVPILPEGSSTALRSQRSFSGAGRDRIQPRSASASNNYEPHESQAEEVAKLDVATRALAVPAEGSPEACIRWADLAEAHPFGPNRSDRCEHHRDLSRQKDAAHAEDLVSRARKRHAAGDGEKRDHPNGERLVDDRHRNEEAAKRRHPDTCSERYSSAGCQSTIALQNTSPWRPRWFASGQSGSSCRT